MRNVFAKTLIYLFFCSSFFLFANYTFSAAEDTLQNDNSNHCINSWVMGLTKNNPEMTEKVIKDVATNFCSCALKQQEMASTSVSMMELRKKLYELCLPYAVLKTSLQNQPATPNKTPDPTSLGRACQMSFPISAKDVEVKNAVMSFCNCASKPLAILQQEKERLSEAGLDNRVHQIVKDCSGE